MPIPPLKRRNYGYLEEEAGRTAPPREKPPKLIRKKNLSANIFIKYLLLLLLLPFKILGKIFKLLGWLWKRRPQLPPRAKLELRKKIFVFLTTLFVLGILGLTALTAWASRDLPDPDRLTDRQVAESTKIYDRTGERLLYEIFAEEKRTMVELVDIPPQLINAVIATEDPAFEHIAFRDLWTYRQEPLGFRRFHSYPAIGQKRYSH